MGNLLFDLTALQPVGGTINHGGKEYTEAVFLEIMKQGRSVSGIYDSNNAINNSYLNYCKEHGELFDINKDTLQNVVRTGKFSAFYSALPYFYQSIDFGNVVFIGNIHGLRSLEAFTDRFEYKYSNSFKSLMKAFIKQLPFVENYSRNQTKKRLEKIIYNPSFVCITGSEHSKYAIVNSFSKIAPERIAVFYDPLALIDPTESNLEIKDYYFLVSGNRWIKNTYRGIIALDQLISEGRINKKVVVTGVTPKSRYLKEIKNKDSFIIKDYVSQELLSQLYYNAYCLVFLSLSEGFGYPPLEAISRGTPAICSPLTAIYEVYQNGVLYCNPLSIEDIKIKILEMEDEIIYKKYKEKGILHGKFMINKQKEELPNLVDYIFQKAGL